MTGEKTKYDKTAILLNLENGDILDRSLERLWKEEDTEIIIIDNHSQDNTREVMDKWCIPENYPRLRGWRWRVIKGQAKNRNFGIKHSHGKYILLLDSDILYFPGSFDYLIKRFDDTQKGIKCIGFNPKNYTNDESEVDKSLPPLSVPLENPPESIALTQYGVFKADLFKRYKIWFDENFGTGYGWEDNDLALQMLKRGFSIKQVSLKYYHNRHTPHWWALHTPEFMRLQERKSYFKKKWGTDAYDLTSSLHPKEDVPEQVTTKLFEDGDKEDIKHLPADKQEAVMNYLDTLEIYRQRNPKKYELKREEAIKKLKQMIYGIQ